MQHSTEISGIFTDTEPSYKSVLRKIHTESVADTISKYPANKVLDQKPPDISDEEKKLPRVARTELSRLRSGYSLNLNSYKSRIDESVENKCPKCGHVPHNTQHLFSCPEDQTDLTVLDLWRKPVQTAAFLGLERRATDDDPP